MEIPLIILLGLSVFVVFCLILSLFAFRATKENKVEHQDYRFQLSRIRRKRNQIKKHTEWQWPIWPRPLLFDEIDKTTQLAFARTENAMAEIEKINEAIEDITLFPANIEAIFDLSGNIKRLITHSKNKRLWNRFYQKSEEIQDSEQIIHENRRKISKLKKAIEKKIVERKDAISTKSLNLNYFQKIGEVRFNDAYQNISTAQTCLNNADLELVSAEQEDMVEWVAAEKFSEAGNIALMIFDFKSQCYSFSENYEADEVLVKLSEITTKLDMALSSLKAHSWKHLVEFNDCLAGCGSELLFAEKSITDFEVAFRKLKDLITQIKTINVEDFEEKVSIAERNLSIYFGQPSESPDLWRRNLSNQDLPSRQLLLLQGEYEDQIRPSIEENIILQSHFPSIIESLEWFLLEIRKIDRAVRRIEKLYGHHFQCEKEVHFRLGINGETNILIERTAEFSENSSRDIKKGCQEGKKLYERYVARANGPSEEAFFPDLLSEVRILEIDLKGLIAQHETLILKLQADAIDLYRKINILQNEILDLKQKPPLIERKWEIDFQDFARINKKYEMTGKNYNLLMDFNSSGKVLFDEKIRLKRSLQQMHDKFFALYDDNMRKINSAINVISGLIIEFKNEWSRPFSETILILNNHYTVYTQMRATLQGSLRDLSLDQAKITCESIKQGLNDYERVKNETIEIAKARKSELEKIDKEVNALFIRRRDKNPSALADARQLVDAARQADDPQNAKELLIKARGILENIGYYLPPVIQYTDQRKEVSFFERVQNKVRVGDVKNVNRSRITIGNKVNERSRGNSRRRRN